MVLTMLKKFKEAVTEPLEPCLLQTHTSKSIAKEKQKEEQRLNPRLKTKLKKKKRNHQSRWLRRL
jgi:hypothetical protein